MAVSTVAEYLSALEKSKLLASEQLVEAQRLAGESSDAAALARALARDNLVSRWQAGTLLALGQRAQLRLGKYKLIQRLGKGGMGTVFLAEHVTMSRRVALKIVPRSIDRDRASLDRFFAEARAIAALDHPNIVQAFSVDNEMDRYFIVMEYVDGQDLQRMVDANGPMDFDSAVDYIRQAAEGLCHAHARNLVHCDVKPSNLLVNNQGVIKILDLGLARLNCADDASGATSGEPVIGTVDYMAPEQALEAENFDHRADIYSLGCTLYFLLTGHPPFPDGTIAQRLAKHQTQEPREILEDRPDAPQGLVDICKRMMAKEPDDRYQSAQEVSEALTPWMNRGGGGVHAPKSADSAEDIASAVAGANDWMDFLSGPATPATKSNGEKKSANGEKKPANGEKKSAAKTPATATAMAAAKPVAAVKKQKNKKASGGGIAAGFMEFCRAKLGWFNTAKRKIIGALGGSVLLAAVAGLAALPWLLSHQKAAQVSSQSKPDDKKQGEKKDEAKSSGENETNNSPDKTEDKKPDASEESEKTPDKAKTSDEHAPKISPLKSSEPEKPKSTEKKPDAKKSEDAKAEEKKAEEKKAEEKKAEEKKAEEKKAEEKKAEEKKAEEKKAEEKKAEEKKAEEKKAQEKKISLEGLSETVELPPLGKGIGDAVSLGKLDLDPKLVNVQLLGGDVVAKGSAKFELQKEDGAANPGSSIKMTEKGKDAVSVARVWQEQNEWKVQWTADAKDKAGAVRYCALLFTCGEKKPRLVALSTPKTVPALGFDSGLGMTHAKCSKDYPLPDLSTLHFQVQPLDKALPKSEIKILEKGRSMRPTRGKSVEPTAGDTVPPKGHVLIGFTKEKTPRIYFEIAFDTHGKDVQLDMLGVCESIAGMPPQQARQMVMRTEAANQSKHKPPKEQAELAQKAKDEFKAAGELMAELSQKGSIPFCVYAALNDADKTQRVVIFQSGQVDNPKAATPKKNSNNKGKPAKGKTTPEPDEFKLQ